MLHLFVYQVSSFYIIRFNPSIKRFIHMLNDLFMSNELFPIQTHDMTMSNEKEEEVDQLDDGHVDDHEEISSDALIAALLAEDEGVFDFALSNYV